MARRASCGAGGHHQVMLLRTDGKAVAFPSRVVTNCRGIRLSEEAIDHWLTLLPGAIV